MSATNDGNNVVQDPVGLAVLESKIYLSTLPSNKQVLVNTIRKEFANLDVGINRFLLNKSRETLHLIIGSYNVIESMMKFWAKFETENESILRSKLEQTLRERMEKVMR